MADRVDQVLLGGVPGELALIIEGNDLGEKSEWIGLKNTDFDTGIDRLKNC